MSISQDSTIDSTNDTSGGSASVAYDVEVIVQEQNPICWIASCAMVKGFGTKTSVGVGEFTGGFDPSNSSIANLAANWGQCFDMMDGWGFSTSSLPDLAPGGVTGNAMLQALQSKGPCLLAHTCAGFPYGSQYAGETFASTDAHAVVLTGIDLDAATATFDNPWGDKDQVCALAALLDRIQADQAKGKQFAFWPDAV